ncbi:MAG: ArsR/SmtB family transcription factor [Chordicoccus sp.]|jgi:DNA-binding transcriptional ArsR family regulator
MEEHTKKCICTLPDEDEMFDLAELFKIFGDSTRIRILFVLFDNEHSVSDIADVLNMTQSAVSHQLKILRQAKLVSSRRDGKQIFYSLADEHVHTIIQVGREHIEE